MRSTSRVVFVALLITAGLCRGGAAEAQAGSSTLEITVRSAEDRRTLAGARVVVEGIRTHHITDQNGFVRITGLPVGGRMVEVRYLGYANTAERLSLEPGKATTAQLLMQIQPIELAEVRVEARMDILMHRGFYDRQRGGQGTFLTRSDIVQTMPRHMSDLLRRMAGISVGNSMFRPSAAIRGPGRSCPIQFFLDGAFTADFNIDEVQPNDVEGLEIYRGAATVPPAYNKGSSTCGVILIWTRIE